MPFSIFVLSCALRTFFQAPTPPPSLFFALSLSLSLKHTPPALHVISLLYLSPSLPPSLPPFLPLPLQKKEDLLRRQIEYDALLPTLDETHGDMAGKNSEGASATPAAKVKKQ